MKNHVTRYNLGNIGMFVHAKIEVEDAWEMTLLVNALEESLEHTKQISAILKDIYKNDKSYKDAVELNTEKLKYLTQMIKNLKVKNEFLTIV